MQGEDTAHGMPADGERRVRQPGGDEHLVEGRQVCCQRVVAALTVERASESQQVGHEKASLVGEAVIVSPEEVARSNQAVQEDDGPGPSTSGPGGQDTQSFVSASTRSPPPHRWGAAVAHEPEADCWRRQAHQAPSPGERHL